MLNVERRFNITNYEIQTPLPKGKRQKVII